MNTAEILDKAADLIEERGHCKRSYAAADGSLCVYGAMRAAVLDPAVDGPDVRDRWDDYETATGWFADYRGDHRIAHWNDAPERTKEEVISTLRAAAQAARAEQ